MSGMFTVSKDLWDNTEEYAPRTIVPEAVGAIIEVVSIDEIQGKKNPGDAFVKVNLITDLPDPKNSDETKEYKFDQWHKVMSDDSPHIEGHERLIRFIKQIGRYDATEVDGEVQQIDLEELAGTVFVSDIRHADNKKDPDSPFINLWSVKPYKPEEKAAVEPVTPAVEEVKAIEEGSAPAEDKDETPEAAAEKIQTKPAADKPKPSKPGRFKRPGAAR